MKKLIPVVVLGVLALTSVVMPSCKKSTDTSRAGMLVGNWKVMAQGTDDNGNGEWDVAERAPSLAGYETTMSFQSDRTGTTMSYMGAVVTIPFTWELVNGDSDIRVICDYAGSIDTSFESIVSFSGTEVVTRRSNGVTTNYSAMERY